MPSPTLLSASSALPSSKVASHVTQAGTAVRRYVLFTMLAGVGCAADLWTKFAVFQWRGMPDHEQPSPIWWLWEGYIGIETALNTGALFGLGRGKVWLFALLSFAALLGIVYWLVWRRASDSLLLTVTLGCITGGVLGNLYDRLGLWSGQQIFAVRDWIRLSCGSYVWPNFNVADSLLVCGAALLVWHSLKSPESR